MNLRDIVNRPDGYPIDQDEAVFVIEQYVKIRKGKEIKGYIETNYGALNTSKELNLMMKMSTHAICWLRDYFSKN